MIVILAVLVVISAGVAMDVPTHPGEQSQTDTITVSRMEHGAN